MTQIDIKKGEFGLIRLFALSMDKADATMLSGNGIGIADALGTGMVDAGGVSVVPIDVLDGMGLYGYLQEGEGVPKDQLMSDRAKIDALDGFVMVVRSSAFKGLAQTLDLTPQVTLIATYREPSRLSGTPTDLSSDSAAAYSGTPEDAAIKAAQNAKTRIPWGLTLTLLVLAGLLFALLVIR